MSSCEKLKLNLVVNYIIYMQFSLISYMTEISILGYESRLNDGLIVS